MHIPVHGLDVALQPAGQFAQAHFTPDIKKALMYSVRGKPFDHSQGAMSSHERKLK